MCGSMEIFAPMVALKGSCVDQQQMEGVSKRMVSSSSREVFWASEPVNVGTSDFQSEVGEVFGEIGGELPAKFGRRFSSFFGWENRQKHILPKLHRKFHHQTSLRGSGLWRAL